MSRKSEEYARTIGRKVTEQQILCENLRGEVAGMEKILWTLLKGRIRDKRQIANVSNRMAAIEREQRRREVSHEQITLLASTVMLCSLLI